MLPGNLSPRRAKGERAATKGETTLIKIKNKNNKKSEEEVQKKRESSAVCTVKFRVSRRESVIHPEEGKKRMRLTAMLLLCSDRLRLAKPSRWPWKVEAADSLRAGIKNVRNARADPRKPLCLLSSAFVTSPSLGLTQRDPMNPSLIYCYRIFTRGNFFFFSQI